MVERSIFFAALEIEAPDARLSMAPEQAGPDARDVDTRADVYALGAVLYELLTGSPPSDRLGSSDDLPTVAANRGTEPARLGRSVRGDLDWVAMKALEKDRGRRYDSAAALADDVGRAGRHWRGREVGRWRPGLRRLPDDRPGGRPGRGRVDRGKRVGPSTPEGTSGRRLVGSLEFPGIAGHFFEIAGRLAAGQRPGWGWFVLAGPVMAGVAHQSRTGEVTLPSRTRCGKPWTINDLD